MGRRVLQHEGNRVKFATISAAIAYRSRVRRLKHSAHAVDFPKGCDDQGWAKECGPNRSP